MLFTAAKYLFGATAVIAGLAFAAAELGSQLQQAKVENVHPPAILVFLTWVFICAAVATFVMGVVALALWACRWIYWWNTTFEFIGHESWRLSVYEASDRLAVHTGRVFVRGHAGWIRVEAVVSIDGEKPVHVDWSDRLDRDSEKNLDFAQRPHKFLKGHESGTDVSVKVKMSCKDGWLRGRSRSFTKPANWEFAGARKSDFVTPGPTFTPGATAR